MENTQSRRDFLQEPLTRRERNILAHLANDRSSQEIAQLENLALSSVKWYIHQVYAKLGVNCRSEAIQRARALSLLSNGPPLPKNNLPRQFSSFIGREQEIEQLLGLIHSYPLVTLTGSGGTGKTRLALQVAEKALDKFPDGVWFIDLVSLSDPTLVPLVAATALGLHGTTRETALVTLCEMIGRRHMLLVIDNCEHLIISASELVNALLHSCHGLHILATSREILGLKGELAFRCPPLTMPDPADQLPFSKLAQFEALRLFTERAASASPGFRLNEANVATIQQICLRLDGIPLAIELAATRMRLLSVQQIASRLDNVFYLLTGGVRSALPRHQTLKAMIDWSYDLLPEPERCLFNRLSVFIGGWTLEAVEGVCTGPGLYPGEILDLLAQLVDKSLVDIYPGRDGEPRYRLLEMIRQYAYNRLEETGGVEAARERHLDFFRGMAVRAEAELRRQTSRLWMERLEDELPNLRAALEWSLGGSVVKGLRLAGGLYWFWFSSKHRLEGLDWLDQLLAAEEAGRASRVEDEPALLERQVARGKALNASAYMGILVNRYDPAKVEEAVAIFRSLGGLYPQDAAYASFLKKDLPLDEYLETAHSIGYAWLAGEVLLQKSFQSCWAGDLDDAEQHAGAGLVEYSSIGDANGVGVIQWEQGTLRFMRGQFSDAAQRYAASRQSYQEAGSVEMQIFMHRFPAWMALAAGRLSEARIHSFLQLEESRAMNIPWVMADALGFLAWEALTDGDLSMTERYCAEAFQLSDRTGKNLLAVANYVMVRLALARGDFARSWTHLKTFIQHNYHNFPPVQLGFQLAGMLVLAQSAANMEQLRLAARLFGAQDVLNPCLMNVIPSYEREAYRASFAALRAALSEREFASALAEGRAMTTSQAVQYIMREC